MSARGVPFAYAGGESVEVSTRGAQWIVCATVGGVKEDIFVRLRAARDAGAIVTIGPHVPDRDGAMRKVKKPHDVSGLEIEPLDDVARASALVARRIEELGLPTYPVDPPAAHVCVHEDAEGTARVAFVMNPTDAKLTARVALPGAAALGDLLRADTRLPKESGAFSVELMPRSVRMFEVE